MNKVNGLCMLDMIWPWSELNMSWRCKSGGLSTIAGAVVLPRDLVVFLKRQERDGVVIDDSKKLTARQRDYSASWLKQEVLAWGVGFPGI